MTTVIASASLCRTELATLEVQRIPNDQLRLQVAVGEAIRRRRLQRRMSQRELARAVGTHRPLVARLEGGHLNNSVGLLFRYAVALECAVSEVLRDAEKLAARVGAEAARISPAFTDSDERGSRS